ncbi:MAG: Rid family hydrolase [Candidatus Sumerlaeota bacterium]|nr:Rid family hydrolase [Candidatus Sumerlaeota bacterium]
MDFYSFDSGTIASVKVSRFQGPSGVVECHLAARPLEYAGIDAQLDCVLRAYRNTLDSLGLDVRTAVLRRFFCSDLANQVAALEARPLSNPHNVDDPCAVSWVRQSPGGPAKVALWAYHVSDPESALDKSLRDGSLTLRRGGVAHHWTTGATCPAAETPYDQTRGIFEKYEAFLRTREMTLADNVVRTWFFVQNVDANYQGLVVARREFFAEHGLTPATHFIASTGIEGAHADAAATVAMDAYAISGVRPEQIEYLAALDHLGPTHVYGVTFERGASVAWRDRKHVFISGTASIDPQGAILHPGDVARQLDRTLDNVEALLKQAGAALKDLCMVIVYVRDASDHAFAQRRMRERFGDAPIGYAVAPVCRPGWLIEVEGQAILPASNPGLPAF